jgi:hypothetical protein
MNVFSGDIAHKQAREAAEILRKFLKMCEDGDSFGQCACDSLAFQPSLGNCLGNTIAQLLSAMGMSGSGFGVGGAGMGGQGGYSAIRGGMQSMGLYGNLPGMGEAPGSGRSGQGDSGDIAGGGFGGQDARDTQSTLDDWAGDTQASGGGEGRIPLRYRRRVSQYFQRLADELEGY